MEKLSLDKFQHFKVESEQSRYVTAGNLCTGGGFYNTYTSDGQIFAQTTYQSDSARGDGTVMWYKVTTTYYQGVQ